ncbi:MAG: hypothetical protein ABR555_14080 [Pyrinomonadaceae bacterium]
MIRRTWVLLVAVLVGLNVVMGQKQMKPYTEWTDKEAEKILNNSAWGRTQTETDTSEMFFRPDGQNAATPNSSVDRQLNGATNQATGINYRVRFLSARPVREAFARRVELQQKAANPNLVAQLKKFVEGGFADYIVVVVDFDTKDARYANLPRQAFAAAVPATLKSTTYLDRNDGKRLFLIDYRPPAADGMGAKFIFPRTFEGKPFLSSDFTQVRFYSELLRVGATGDLAGLNKSATGSKQIKIDVRFKVADMNYNGQLEY